MPLIGLTLASPGIKPLTNRYLSHHCDYCIIRTDAGPHSTATVPPRSSQPTSTIADRLDRDIYVAMADQLDLDEKASAGSDLRHQERHAGAGHGHAAIGLAHNGRSAAAAIAPRLMAQVALRRIDNSRAKNVAVLPGDGTD